MNIEDEFKEFKRKQLKRARVTALVLGATAVLCILFMIYGFTQSIEANRQRDLNESMRMKTQQLEQELVKCQEEKKNN